MGSGPYGQPGVRECGYRARAPIQGEAMASAGLPPAGTHDTGGADGLSAQRRVRLRAAAAVVEDGGGGRLQHGEHGKAKASNRRRRAAARDRGRGEHQWGR